MPILILSFHLGVHVLSSHQRLARLYHISDSCCMSTSSYYSRFLHLVVFVKVRFYVSDINEDTNPPGYSVPRHRLKASV